MNCQASWVDVLVDCVYTQGLFTYLVPSNLDVQPGDIVMVGFGEQQLGAIAIRRSLELPDGIDPQQVRPVEEIVAKSFFSSHYWRLLWQVAGYYQTDLMTVARMALPPGLLEKSQPRVQ